MRKKGYYISKFHPGENFWTRSLFRVGFLENKNKMEIWTRRGSEDSYRWISNLAYGLPNETKTIELVGETLEDAIGVMLERLETTRGSPRYEERAIAIREYIDNLI